MVRPLFLTLLLFLSAAVRAEDEPVTPQQALLWSLFIPGGGHFRQGDWGTGLGYAGSELALGVWGYNQSLGLEKDEVDMPFLYLQQVHVMGMYTAYREARLKGYDEYYKHPVDPTPAPVLAAAPFRWSVVKSPWVWGAALAGAGINWLGASTEKDRKSYRRMSAMRLQGHTYDRREAAWAYHGYWAPAALGAGLSEEMLFRGVLQAEWDEVYGPRTALISSSVLFGLAHLSNFHKDTVSNAVFAGFAGIYLGHLAQKNDYRLSEGIAAHAWFDLAAGTVIFLADPKNNPIGAKVSFAY